MNPNNISPYPIAEMYNGLKSVSFVYKCVSLHTDHWLKCYVKECGC